MAGRADAAARLLAVPAAEITERQRAALAAGLGSRLAGTAPFTAMAGPPVRVPTGILLDLDDDEGKLEQVRGRVMSAVTDACGRQTPLAGHRSPPHMSESYARGRADDDRVDRALGSVRPRRAPLAVDSAELVDVSVDQAAKSLTWRQIARIPFGG